MNWTWENALDQSLIGTSGGETLIGYVDRADTIIGKAGNDTLVGYGGADTYVFSSGDGQDYIDLEYNDNPSKDVVKFTNVASTAVTVIHNVDDLVLAYGGTNKITIGSAVYNNYAYGNAGYRISQFQFSDGVNWTWENALDQSLIGTSGGETLIGYVDRADTINGKAGNDTLIGYGGADTYVFSAGDGQDTINGDYNDSTSKDVVKFTNVAMIDLTNINKDANGSLVVSYGAGDQLTVLYHFSDPSYKISQFQFAGGDTLTNFSIGTSANNKLTGTNANDAINGLIGADTMAGGLGNDLYFVDNIGDVVTEATAAGTDTVLASISYTLTDNVENLALLAGALTATGNALANTLTGNAANNSLDGGTGADSMVGGKGDDSYMVDNIGDTVTELAGEGTDNVSSSVSFTLSDNVENLALTGGANNNATGNSLNNSLLGSSGANVLDGGLGADTLTGGLGNDTYIIDDLGDVVTETSTLATEVDSVISGIGYTLGSNLENLTLAGSSAINGFGNELNNTLIGNTAANTLNGGAGSDSLMGGLGDDTYIIDNSGDTVTELAGEGIDSVLSSISIAALAANVENLTLTGTGLLDGTGNGLDNSLLGTDAVNQLYGLAGNDLLDGGLGADSLVGGAGDDTYIVDNIGDVVTELAGEGTDTVNSAITYVLGNELENLQLTGTAIINATGNSLANRLTGNSANNKLDGKAGADVMLGGLGNDSYTVDNIGDSVTELASEGTDTITSSIAWTLGVNLENLTLSGTQAIAGNGNALNNTIKGNAAANTLFGDAGTDSLTGGNGMDVLIGGIGKDKLYLAETVAVTDTVKIATGDSKFNGYDVVENFALGNGVINTNIDQLDLDSTTIAANTAATDGVDKGIIKSHTISNGLISFDDVDSFTANLVLTVSNLTDVFGYLQNNIKSGNTVAFNAVGNTYLFQDGGNIDTVVQLTGVTASNINTTGLVADGVWLV